ncbi:MAG: heptaprenyl diphosphate synthase subunit II [Candidatus Binatia bacterium]|nr:MAG: heptaprenyl diphosphate synthase subunit II [Candidatus Binatia bacterium]
MAGVEPKPVEVPTETAWTLADGLARVEQRIQAQLQSREPLLTEISSYLVGSGGKRVRPAVTLLIYKACGGRVLDAIVDVAAALELIHSATLLHDDIIDNAETRRGRPSALHRYGLARTLVTGDFVFTRAFELCAPFEEKLIRWAAEACISLTEGEIMQGRFRHNPAVTVPDYLEIIGRKTASLFQQGARAAAYLAGAPIAVVDAMAECGFHVGLVFQIVDDVLDIEGDPNKLGKPVGIDFRDGNPSLPIVIGLSRDPSLREFFKTPRPSEVEIQTALERVRACGAVEEARTLARAFGERAKKCLARVPQNEETGILSQLVEQLLARGL